jgi:hypothetical protein
MSDLSALIEHLCAKRADLVRKMAAYAPGIRKTAGACGNAGSGRVLQLGRTRGRQLIGLASVGVGRVDRVRKGGGCRCESDGKKCDPGHGHDPPLEGLGTVEAAHGHRACADKKAAEAALSSRVSLGVPPCPGLTRSGP